MKGGRLYTLVFLLATISSMQCIPIEVIYTGDGCDCPKSLNYVVNLPPTSKPKEYTPSEYGYKLDVPIQGKGKAKVTYTFDFTVQEPKTPSPIEQEKWDLFAKIDRITAHKKDCIAEEGSSRSCSCNKCKSSRRYVSTPAASDIISRSFHHPNSLSKITREIAPDIGPSPIGWAAFIKPLNRKILADPIEIVDLKTRRRRRDLSRFFLRNRKSNPKKETIPKVKQYNKSLRSATPLNTNKPNLPGLFNGKGPFQQLGNFMKLPRFRNKRDIKGEYDLIEKERDEMDLTIPEIIQYMPETLDPNFKRGQCQFGNCATEHQHVDGDGESNISSKESAGNSLASMEKEVKTQGDKDKKDNQNAADGDDDDEDESHDEENHFNEINSTHTKRNAGDYGPSPLYNNYKGPGVYAPSYNAPSHGPPLPPPPPPPPSSSNFYSAPLVNAHIAPPYAGPYSPYNQHPAYINAHPHHNPHPYPYHHEPQSRTMYALPPPPPITHHITSPYYNAPSYVPTTTVYSTDYQLDSIIADIINRHSDFLEAGYHEGGALVDPPSSQRYQNKALFKTLIGGKWQRYALDDNIGAPKIRRDTSVVDQPHSENEEI